MTNNNICSDPAYLNAINQRERFALLNNPPTRYDNLAINPYETIDPSTLQPFTQNQLDMRRKVEILKYTSNRMSTQTNSLTKSQKYSQLVKGSFQQRTYSRQYLSDLSNGIFDQCDIRPTPSTSCDVPGPAIQLYEDINVPVYNLMNDVNTNSRGIINAPEPPFIWNYTQNKNIPLDISFVTITSLYFLNTINTNDIFTLSVPLSATIHANTINNALKTAQTDISFSITDAQINVLYSYSSVQLQTIPTMPIDISSIHISIDLSNNNSFTANVYLGEIVIDNLFLYIQKGYIYDIQLHVDWTYTAYNNYENYLYAPTVMFYVNPTILSPQINCSIDPSNNISSQLLITSLNSS